jgi:hypothetical protein
VGRRTGGRRGRRRGRGKGRRRGRGQRLNNRSLSLIRWRLIGRVERRKGFRVKRGFREGFG